MLVSVGPTIYHPMSLQPHQIRVVQEKADLDEKIVKLKAFLDNVEAHKHLGSDELIRLSCQLAMMNGYSNILGDRIAAFPVTEDFQLGKACDLSGEGTCEACQ